MEKLINKLQKFRNTISNRISELIETHGVRSQHYLENVLVIQDDEFCFNIEGSRWLVEISESNLIDNSGYLYNHDVLEIEKLCEVIDHISKTSVNFKISYSNDGCENEYFKSEKEARKRFDHIKRIKSVSLEQRVDEADRNGLFFYEIIEENEIKI